MWQTKGGLMTQDFVRAHGDEQKAVRVDQIVEAALALYDEIGYDKLTFSKLAKGLGFTRINLYNYFKTKEELFLEIVRREYDALLADAEKSLPRDTCPQDVYIEAWTSVVSRHGRALELFVLMNMQILRNVSPERQKEFQGYLDDMVGCIAQRVQTCLGLSEDDAWDLVAHQLNYAMGLYPITLRMHGKGGAQDAFAQRYAGFLETLLTGMRQGLPA